MALAKTTESPTSRTKDEKAEAFIRKAGITPAITDEEGTPNKKQSTIRIPPDLIKRIDKGAARLGISRSAFLVQSAAEKLERMGG
jgi:hypothetical protein